MKNIEVQNRDTEIRTNNYWDELSSQKMNLDTKEELNQKNNFKTIEEKQDDLLEAANRVREAYQEKDRGEALPSTNETQKITPDLTTLETKSGDFVHKDNGNHFLNETEQPEATDQKSSLTWMKKISENYDKQERPRIDKIKAGLSNYKMMNEARRKQVSTRPGLLKQATRFVMDKLGIKTSGSEERRNREAMHIALIEYHEEELLCQKEWEEKQKIEAAQQKEREARKAVQERIEKAQREQEELEREMQTARDIAEQNKRNRFEKQRIQEIVEQDLNSRLLKVEDLETEAFSNNPEIQKHEMVFEGSEIPVYDLKGLPFAILSHTVDYRNVDNPLDEIGQNTYREVMKNPGVWNERQDKAMEASGFGTRNENARGDTISTSFRDSEKNIDSYVPGELIYGFEQVSADSIISISNGDGGTSNMAGRSETNLNDPNILDQITGANGTSIYNEVLLRRYSENGIPKTPDYIITNGTVSETALKHAKFFNIPIINIDRVAYEKKMEKHGEELLDSINEKNDYLELNQKLEELLSMSKYKNRYRSLDSIGRKFDIPTLPYGATALEERLFEVSKLEQQKRLNFIEGVLENYISEIEQATRENKLAPEPDQIKNLNIVVSDVGRQLRSIENSDIHDGFRSVAGNCNSIEISFTMKDGSRTLKTNIYDGENIFELDQAIKSGRVNAEDLKQANSSFYHQFEPLVRRYFEAYRENQKINGESDL